MKLKDIISFLDEKIPKKLAIENDDIGFKKEYDLNQEINSIKILMDLYPCDDKFNENTLIITHHSPLFVPETPTYTIHSNWDIIDGGANDLLANKLNLKVIDYFDKKTGIGRICETNISFNEFKKTVLDNFNDVRFVNQVNDNIKKVGVISGFGLKNLDYIKLASKNDLDILISGDLTQESAVLAKNLNITLIDLGHHNSEVPGLYGLANIINELNINCEVINKPPITIVI